MGRAAYRCFGARPAHGMNRAGQSWDGRWCGCSAPLLSRLARAPQAGHLSWAACRAGMASRWPLPRAYLSSRSAGPSWPAASAFHAGPSSCPAYRQSLCSKRPFTRVSRHQMNPSARSVHSHSRSADGCWVRAVRLTTSRVQSQPLLCGPNRHRPRRETSHDVPPPRPYHVKSSSGTCCGGCGPQCWPGGPVRRWPRPR